MTSRSTRGRFLPGNAAARTHGLATPATRDPRLRAEVEATARALAGSHRELLGPATSVADAAYDVGRVRRLRTELLWSPEIAPGRLEKLELALKRYDRRATSRRNGAIRALDQARVIAEDDMEDLRPLSLALLNKRSARRRSS